jgi:hypothetical protein
MARRKSIAVPDHMLFDGDLVNQRQGYDKTIVLVRINNWLTHGINPDEHRLRFRD